MINISYDYKNYWQSEFERRQKEGYYQKLYGQVRSFYNFAEADEIIDIGGGNGQLLNFLGAKKVTLLDISDSGINFAREKLGFKTIKQDLAKKLKVKEGCFNVAFCCEVLEHLRKPTFVLREINRVLKKGGILYVGQGNMKPDGKHHLSRIHFRLLVKLLKENNFELVDWKIVPGFLTNRFSNLKRAYNDSLRKSLAIISGSILNIILPRLVKQFLADNLPRYFGGFYHVKAKKI